MNRNLPTSQPDNEREQARDKASEHEMIKYFLGKLSADEEQTLERLFFSDNQLFDRLQAVKENLIDDYLREILSEEDRSLFERNFLSSPPQREQVEFARALMQKLSQFS